MQDDQERTGWPSLSGAAALTHLSGQQQPGAQPLDESWPPQAHDDDERAHGGDARGEQDEGEVEIGYLAEASANREFWSDSDDGDDDEDEDAEPWEDLGTRSRRRRRVPLAVTAGAAVTGVALLAGIWSMASSGEDDPAGLAAAPASSTDQPILESPPPLPEGEPTDSVTTVKPTLRPTTKPTKPPVIKTTRPTPAPVVTPTVKRTRTAKPTTRKYSVNPVGPTEAPPPPTGEQDDEPPQSGPTEAPPPPGE